MRLRGDNLAYAWMKPTGLLQRLLVWVWLAMPLIFLPNSANRAQLLRFIAIVVIAGLATAPALARCIKQRPALSRTIVAGSVLMTICLVVTWVVRVTSPFHVYYAGVDTEYLGFIAWLAFIVLGLVFASTVQHLLFSRPALIIGGLILLVSMFFGLYDVAQGLRLSGILYQPLAMAVYANLMLVLYLQRMREQVSANERRLLTIAVATCMATVVLCQTLVGTMLMILLLAVWSMTVLRRKTTLRTCLLAVAVIAALLPTIAPGYFAGIRSDNGRLGLANKASVYKQYVPAIVRHNWLYGQGPSALPKTINNQNYVPEDILKNLGIVQSFSASHDLFLDISYFFGLAAGISLLVITLLALRRCFSVSASSPAYGLVLLVLLVDALFDKPSLILTSMYFVVLFGTFAKYPTTKLRGSKKAVA